MIRNKSVKTQYNASYWSWLKGWSKDFTLVPFNHGEEIVTAFTTVLTFLTWILVIVIFPISFPVLSFIAMKLTKRDLEKRWGKGKLIEESKKNVHT